MNKEVNYKNKKKYNTAKYPIRQPMFIVWLIWLLSKIMLLFKNKKLEKINMEGLKPPYMLLSNHMSFVDFELTALMTTPHRINNVVNIDGYYMRPWLMELIGAICTRKFTMDLHLIKSIKKCFPAAMCFACTPKRAIHPAALNLTFPIQLVC